MATQEFILVFDHGTTSIRACLMDRRGQIVARDQQQFEQIYPQPGWVEHNANTLWKLTLEVAQGVLKKHALKNAKLSWQEIAAIGVTNQRETTILWDKETGEPIYNAIVWQCRRTTELCSTLKEAGHEKTVHQKTGLVLDPYFSASKIQWLLDNVPKAKELQQQNRLMFGTVDTWILWNLSGRKVHVTDYTNASRTMLYNIVEKRWDDELLNLFGVPKAILPEVKPSNVIYGVTDPALTGGCQIPLAGDVGDQQAALHGQKCWQPGTAKSTYGTGAFLVMNTGDQFVPSKRGLLTTLATDADGNPAYALEGAVFIAGAALEWLEKKLEFFKHPSEIDGLATSLSGNEQVYLVPAFAGLGAPYWNASVRGTLVGLTQDTGKAHFVRAALESMAYQTKEVLDAMLLDSEEAGNRLALKTLRVDGGVTKSHFLSQFLANMLNVSITRTDDPELTAKGAGYLAGLAVGFWKTPDDIANLPETLEALSPATAFDDGQRACLFAGWHKAIRQTLCE